MEFTSAVASREEALPPTRSRLPQTGNPVRQWMNRDPAVHPSAFDRGHRTSGQCAGILPAGGSTHVPALLATRIALNRTRTRQVRVCGHTYQVLRNETHAKKSALNSVGLCYRQSAMPDTNAQLFIDPKEMTRMRLLPRYLGAAERFVPYAASAAMSANRDSASCLLTPAS